MSLLKKIFIRAVRTVIGKHGIYGRIGRRNHFREGVRVYENATVGHDNYFAPYCLINNAVIGNYNSFGPSCKIGMADHDLKAISTYPRMNNGKERMEEINIEKPTVIEHDVWIGANVVVRQGVHVRTGAVLGANTVVTHDVDAYEIVVGIPAKHLRYRFDDNTRNILLDSKWFDLQFLEAKKIVQKLDQEIIR